MSNREFIDDEISKAGQERAELDFVRTKVICDDLIYITGELGIDYESSVKRQLGEVKGDLLVQISSESEILIILITDSIIETTNKGKQTYWERNNKDYKELLSYVINIFF